MTPRGRVFVTDGMQRKALAAVRGLARSGFEVVVGETTRFAPAMFSRRARARVVYPSPREAPEAFVAALAEALRRHRCDVLLPMEEDTLLTVLGARERLERRARIPFPERERILALRDKGALPELAARAGVRAPATALVRAGEGAGAAAGLRGPLVVKPRIGSGARGLRYADDARSLERALAEVHARHGDAVVQERIPAGGGAVCVTLLVDPGGGVRASFAHRRLREYPATGGASTWRVSERAPEEEAAAVRLLRCAGWRGVAHVEFRRDPRDGGATLVEINPRFPGSLNLAVEAGVDFASLLVRWALGEDARAPVWRERVEARWLLPGDILSFLARARQGTIDWSFFRFTGRRLRFDDWAAGDWFPVVGAALAAAPMLTRAEFRRQWRR